jgi:hypothetical protein
MIFLPDICILKAWNIYCEILYTYRNNGGKREAVWIYLIMIYVKEYF